MSYKKIFGMQPHISELGWDWLNEPKPVNDTTDNHWDGATTEPKPGINVSTDWNTTEPTPSTVIDILTILSHYSSYQLAQNIGIYSNPVLFILGTIGNFFSVLIMTRKSMIKASTCYYMAALGVADTLVLLCACFRSWLSYITQYDILNSSAEVCKITSFMCYWSFSMSAWILVAMTIDRYIVIHYPLKVHKYSTIKRTQKVIALISLLLIGFTMHYLFTVSINEHGYCQAIKEHKKKFLEMVWPWLDATVYSFIPFVLLVIFNGLIIYDHRKALKRRTSLQSGYSDSNRNPVSTIFTNKCYGNTRLTFMLLLVSITFLITSSPKTIIVIVRPYIFDIIYDENNAIDYSLLGHYMLASAIADVFMYANHSFNFILYCLSGSKFRDELKRILMICFCQKKRLRKVSSYSAVNMRRNSSLCTINMEMENAGDINPVQFQQTDF